MLLANRKPVTLDMKAVRNLVKKLGEEISLTMGHCQYCGVKIDLRSVKYNCLECGWRVKHFRQGASGEMEENYLTSKPTSKAASKETDHSQVARSCRLPTLSVPAVFTSPVRFGIPHGFLLGNGHF